MVVLPASAAESWNDGACSNPSTLVVLVGGPEVQCHPLLRSEFGALLGYSRSSLKYYIVFILFGFNYWERSCVVRKRLFFSRIKLVFHSLAVLVY